MNKQSNAALGIRGDGAFGTQQLHSSGEIQSHYNMLILMAGETMVGIHMVFAVLWEQIYLIVSVETGATITVRKLVLKKRIGHKITSPYQLLKII